MSQAAVISSSPSTGATLAGLFDVAISFTARDPAAADLANELADALRSRGLRTFHFRSIEEAARVLGERLSETLPAIYRQRALVAVLIASPSYGQTHWTRVELHAALSRPRDDDGQPRLVPISADGSRIADLPEDVIHLGERVNSAELRDELAADHPSRSYDQHLHRFPRSAGGALSAQSDQVHPLARIMA